MKFRFRFEFCSFSSCNPLDRFQFAMSARPLQTLCLILRVVEVICEVVLKYGLRILPFSLHVFLFFESGEQCCLRVPLLRPLGSVDRAKNLHGYNLLTLFWCSHYHKINQTIRCSLLWLLEIKILHIQTPTVQIPVPAFVHFSNC